MTNDNESDVKIAALKAHNKIIRDETKVLAKALVGEVSDHDAVSQILNIVDSPQRFEADRLYEQATGESADEAAEAAEARQDAARLQVERPSRRVDVDEVVRLGNAAS